MKFSAWRTAFRPRISVRWLMGLVAGVALILGCYAYAMRLARLSEDYRKHAVYHETAMSIHVLDCKGAPSKVQRPTPNQLAALSAYHQQLQRKYEQAARAPWWPIEPDPPEPEGAHQLRFGS